MARESYVWGLKSIIEAHEKRDAIAQLERRRAAQLPADVVTTKLSVLRNITPPIGGLFASSGRMLSAS